MTESNLHGNTGKCPQCDRTFRLETGRDDRDYVKHLKSHLSEWA